MLSGFISDGKIRMEVARSFQQPCLGIGLGVGVGSRVGLGVGSVLGLGLGLGTGLMSRVLFINAALYVFSVKILVMCIELS